MTTRPPLHLRFHERPQAGAARWPMAVSVLVLVLSAPCPQAGAQAPLRDVEQSISAPSEADGGRDPRSGDARDQETEPEPPSDLGNRPAVWPLRVVSWHLDAAGGAGAIDIQPTPQRVWRHTFGAERRDAPKSNFDITRLNADVVLLQGVRLIAHARLLFPARDWRVVISRQSVRPVLAPSQAGPGWGDLARTPTTAIAIRYQRGVRIAGVEHMTDIVMGLAAASGEPPETAAALAVRLRVDSNIVWLVSAELPLRCLPAADAARVSDAAARSCAALSRWLASRRPGDRVVVGGPFAASAAAPNAMEANGSDASGSSCPRQAIASIGARAGADDATLGPSRGDAVAVSMARVGADTGCLARLEVMGDDYAAATPAANAIPVAGEAAK